MIQQFLRRCALFSELDDEDLTQLLMIGRTRRFPPESMILAEGTLGSALHVIHTGKVRISKVVPGVGEEALAILDPGDVFGEIGFFDGGPASASALAHSECEIFSIPHAEMRALIAARPDLAGRFLWAFGRTLARRLRETNQKMATLFAISHSS